MAQLSHLDEQGRARMVDVSEKEVTSRIAIARGSIHMRAETLSLILEDKIEKGDVFSVARVAGIMAAKKTSELIPMCHPLNITAVEIELSPQRDPCRVDIEASVRVSGKTGVEMEAMTAGIGGRTNDLRHVQSRRPRDVDHRNPAREKKRRQERDVHSERIVSNPLNELNGLNVLNHRLE